MIGNLTGRKDEILSACLILLALTLSCSCGNSASGLPENKTAQEVDAKPRESPVPLQPTKENKGKRCEARYYFGLRSKGQDEGFDSFCYQLQTRLVNAAREGNLAEIRETLKLGANLNLPVKDSDPPLYTAASNGQADAVRLLLDNGANVNVGTFIRGTPLIVASTNGHAVVVRILLARGANLCLKADGFKPDGDTAEDAARREGHKDVVELLKAAGAEKCT